MDKRIGILGAGLIGGSIFKKLPNAWLLEKNWIEQLDEIDVLVLAIPISQILEMGEKIARHPIKRKLMIIDVGSVKGIIAKKFEEWTDEDLEFIATHPMAGKEKSGWEASDAALFQDAAWVITPHAKNREASLQKVEALISDLGAKPFRMQADEHDRKVALISQLPYLISKTLFDFVGSEAMAIAGPGFKSMVRLANDNPVMREEIGVYNEENIMQALQGYIRALEKMV